MTVVTVLHPGAMGAAVGRLAVLGGASVRWVAASRSAETRHRATKAGLVECADVATALDGCDVVLSICPPAYAEATAGEVRGFTGVYVDANAVAPERLQNIAALLPEARVVDGGIIGAPPQWPGTTRLYLSGPARGVPELFRDTALDVITISDRIGQASALKIAYASYQKASRVLAATAHALAEAHGVGTHLAHEAELLTSRPLAETEAFAVAAARAWRWAPEMREAAAALDAAGLPTGIAEGAAEAFERWNAMKDRTDLPVADVLTALADAVCDPPSE